MNHVTASIVPTIDAEDAGEYRRQVERVANFARRLHIDIADGVFTPKALISAEQVWWPGGVRADIHVMHRQPSKVLEVLAALEPQLVILHAEADGDFEAMADYLHRRHIEVGVALLADTPAELLTDALVLIDHVLVFSGALGRFGGNADLKLLDKVRWLKSQKPQLEIGWDGGVNPDNVLQLAAAGVEVLNTGGYIHKAADSHAAYATLEAALHPSST